MVNVTGRLIVSSSVVTLASPEMEGKVFVATTVRVKIELAVRSESETTTVTTDAPVAPGRGVNVTVRLESNPPKAIPPRGSTLGSEVDADMASALADVS